MKASSVVLGLALVLPAAGREILHADFEADPPGPYSRATCAKSFPGVTWDNGLTGQSRVSVVAGGDTAGGGHALRVFYPAKSLGPSGTGGALPSGAQWPSVFGGVADTLYSSYRVFFPTGFDWVKGEKLPGLCGDSCITGGNLPTGTNGWSARLMWRANASLVQYVYAAGQGGKYGTDVVWKSGGQPLVVETGKWHQVQVKICLNTPGTNGSQGRYDGRVMGWYDGVLALDTIGFRFRDRAGMHIDQFYFSTFYGGGTTDFESLQDNRIFFDDFAVSDSMIRSPAARVPRPVSARPGNRLLGRTLKLVPGQVGSLEVRNLFGRELAAIALQPDQVNLPRDLPRGLVALAIPSSGWSALAMVP